MDDLILFTHIPKTSGTSFIEEMVKSNLDSNQICHVAGLRKIIPALQKEYKFIYGHFGYGIHLFTQKKVNYITFLRDPIDQAVSFYYFVQQDKDNPRLRHPLCDYAESVTLKEFYKTKNFHNIQTRFIAGFMTHKLYPLCANKLSKNIILKKAIHNLKNNYAYFGILEERENSLTLFQNKFALDKRIDISHKKRTRSRPKIEEIDDKTIKVIKQANNLDSQLYSFALKFFKSKIQGIH